MPPTLQAPTHPLGRVTRRDHAELSCRLLQDKLQFEPHRSAMSFGYFLEASECTLTDVGNQYNGHLVFYSDKK
jgi:hypothetical protein